MKDIIARLRELHTDWEKYEKREPHEPQPYSDQIAEALPQLLDRLEKLEVVAEDMREAHRKQFEWALQWGEARLTCCEDAAKAYDKLMKGDE